MDDLVVWLRAQFDEDERTVRATVWEGSGNKLEWELIASATIDVGGDEFYVGDRTIANHMMAWEPARVLREIDAKRQLLALHQPVEQRSTGSGGGVATDCQVCSHFPARYPCATVRLLALPYADRPGFRPEWVADLR
ncbi:DUF6221 family protein [Streptomyces sp. NPDC096048]|uniref:DUF6221 family protein n=1 Tax=Streptomyces sp. NPDC096048 TaxID=3366072 RepID=UPI0038106780